MCARFNLATPELAGRYFQGRLEFDEQPMYNIAPSEIVLAAVAADSDLKVEPQQWGMQLGRPAKVINLRSETNSVDRSLGPDPRFRRCLIPATGFFEWREENKIKQPYNFVLRSGEVFAFAGLCQQTEIGPAEFVILTTAPNELVAEYHDRMPTMIEAASAEAWLHSEERDEVRFLARAPFPAIEMAVYPVTRKMSSPRFKNATSIERSVPENPSLF